MNKSQYYNGDADVTLQIYFKEDPVLGKEPHFHDSVEFIFIKKGKTEVFLDDESKTMEEGEIFFAESYRTHSYNVLTKEFSAYVIVLSREYSKAFRDLYPEMTLPPYMTDKEKNEELFAFVSQWFQKEEKTTLFNMGAASILFSTLAQKYQLENRKEYTGDILLKELLKYIHTHYLEDISLKGVAHEFGYSVEHCCKLLRRAINCNFREYVNELRFRKARELMADKSLNMSQSEILYACGFTNPATYYRVKKQFQDNSKDK